ncbi:MAG: LbtU family siderophore porin [Desulfobulbaceae bacterium]|nr:LbtU family siderophore porin [Desulfobulbaceae bacterium]
MPTNISKLLPALLLLATATPALAEPAGEIEELRHRLEKLEARENGAEGFALATQAGRLTMFGAIEVEGSYRKTADRNAESDTTVATALLGFEAAFSDRVKGRIVLLHEEGEEPNLDLDEANLTLTRPETLAGTFSIRAGHDHLPFGAFTSVMVSDPLTLDLGEISKTGLISVWENGKIALKLAVFNGDRDSSGHDVIDNGVAALIFTPTEQISVGASYLCDLAESDFGLLANATAPYESNVNAASAYLTLKFSPVTINLEYLGALQEFSEGMLADPDRAPELTGRKPRAWFAEATFAHGEDWAVSGRYEQAKDYQDDVARYGATVSYGLDTNTTLSLEYLYSDFARTINETAQQVTVQLALEF